MQTAPLICRYVGFLLQEGLSLPTELQCIKKYQQQKDTRKKASKPQTRGRLPSTFTAARLHVVLQLATSGILPFYSTIMKKSSNSHLKEKQRCEHTTIQPTCSTQHSYKLRPKGHSEALQPKTLHSHTDNWAWRTLAGLTFGSSSSTFAFQQTPSPSTRISTWCTRMWNV